jgi:DNA-binding IclR family transcriptional regulator
MPNRPAKIKEMHAAGERPTEIAKKLNVARSSVYRLLDPIFAA